MGDWSLHFAQPAWLLALPLILPIALWLQRSHARGQSARLRRYADPHLLPHLTGSRELTGNERSRRLLTWSLLWTLLTLAMAGPRWDATQIHLFRPGASLVVLLDISRSMEVTDVRPSRIHRARQEIEDLLDQGQGTAVGLIAFASVAHVMSPVTEDRDAILSRLPAIATDLVRLQGSRLVPALEQAELLLAGQPQANSRDILIISDGDFADQDLDQRISGLHDKGISVHILGIGTTGGGPVPAEMGRFMLTARGEPIESALDTAALQRLAQLGGGLYFTADFKTHDSEQLVRAISANAAAHASTRETTRVWKERFYWLVAPAMLLLLPFFRRSRPLPEVPKG